MEGRTRKNTTRLKIVLIIAGSLLLLLIVAFFIILPPSSGKLQSFKDENGEIMENSLVEKNYIDVGDYKLGSYILSKNVNNPVLLVCGGGPGIPQFLMEAFYPSILPDYFTVCYFDYRGAGRSYDKSIDPETIVTDLYLNDVRKITDYLCERFNKDKIYIMGHSFGSYIALNTVNKYPERYLGYLAVSQIVNQFKSEFLAIEYMKNEYQRNGNTNMYNALAKYDLTNKDNYLAYFSNSIRDKAMHDLGVGTTRDMNNVIKGLFFPSLRCKYYTISERINIWKGKAMSSEFPVIEEIRDFDATKEIPSLNVPIYFFTGAYDYTCTHTLQKEYYDMIDAPIKKFYFYSEAAHSPIYEDSSKTKDALNEILSLK